MLGSHHFLGSPGLESPSGHSFLHRGTQSLFGLLRDAWREVLRDDRRTAALEYWGKVAMEKGWVEENGENQDGGCLSNMIL